MVLCHHYKDTKETAIARFKPENRDQGVMIPISYHRQIISSTIEYAIDYILYTKINTETLKGRYKNDKTGASACSLKMLLKIVFLVYSRGIISSRKIMQARREKGERDIHIA